MSQGSDIRTFMMRATAAQASLATRAVSLRVLAGVVLRTPVDTGRARANWQTSIGPGSGQATEDEDKSGRTALANGTATIARQRGAAPVHLENNLPYIQRLEEGSSRQAPAGMVGLTIASLGLSGGREG